MNKELDKQLKKFRKEFGNKILYDSNGLSFELRTDIFYDKLEQFLTNFYHEIRKAEQKSKIIAIEKKMLKDSFIDDLVELRVKAQRDEIIKKARIVRELSKMNPMLKQTGDTNKEYNTGYDDALKEMIAKLKQ